MQRMVYATDLSQYIQVDIFGKCGQEMLCPKGMNISCRPELMSHYKFYLAFENSNCREYITEKLYTVALR